jgi:putative SOS response-associated peptidase YedK
LRLPLRSVGPRVETVTRLPSFREAIRKRRAAAIACGYYDWTGEKWAKQPWRLVRQDGLPITFTAIFETWRPRQDQGPGRELRHRHGRAVRRHCAYP